MVWRIFATKLETAETMEDADLHMRAPYFYPDSPEAEVAELHRQIGKLKVKNDFLSHLLGLNSTGENIGERKSVAVRGHLLSRHQA